MKKYAYSLLPWLLVSNIVYADPELDTSKLVKVTPANAPACVEYYNYKGEMYCSTTALQHQVVTQEIKDYEKLKIQFDERAWQAAWGKKEPDIITVEYVPMGDDINHWHELITSQFLPTLKATVHASQFAHFLQKKFIDTGFKPIITFLEESPEQTLMEVRLEAPDNMKQDELILVFRAPNKDGMFVLHYVIKQSDMGSEKRAKWIANLKASKPKT